MTMKSNEREVHSTGDQPQIKCELQKRMMMPWTMNHISEYET